MFTSKTTSIEESTKKVPEVTDIVTYSKNKKIIEVLKTDTSTCEHD